MKFLPRSAIIQVLFAAIALTSFVNGEVRVIANLEEFKAELAAAGDKLVLVNFHAQWCEPCVQITQMVEQISNEEPDDVFLEVDVDEADDVAEKYLISAMPTFVLLRNSQKVDEVIGANVEQVKQMINRLKSESIQLLHFNGATKFY